MRLSKNLNLTSALLALMFGSFAFLFSCADDEEPGLAIPVILSVSPGSGSPGDAVTITGTDLGEAISVTFNGVNASITSNSEMEIVTAVPENSTTGLITVVTDGGSAVSSADFEVVVVGAVSVSSVSRISAQEGENVILTGTDMSSVSNVSIGGVDATVVGTTESTVEITIGSSPLGRSTFSIVNDGGTTETSSEELEFYVIEVLPNFNDTFDGDTTYFSTGGDAEIYPDRFGISNVIPGATLKPAEIQGNYYHIEGLSDTNDSGSYTGQVGHRRQDAGFFSDFFAAGSDVAEYYYNVNINFGSFPADYDDVLAGFRLRFDEGYDADMDGSTSDEYLEFRPTPSGLSDLGYSSDENGWFSLSISFDKFISSGANNNAGSWDVYDIDQMTRFAMVSRRDYDDEYSMSFDNLFITRGGPYSFPE